MTAAWQGIVENIRRTATARGRARAGLYSIEGTRLHERALRAGRQVRAAVISQRFASQDDERAQRLLTDLQASGCQLAVVPDEVLSSMTKGRGLGDIVGLVPLPQPADLGAIMAQSADVAPIFLALVDVVDPGNLGALVRTAHASGAGGLLVAGEGDPFHPKAVRTSMGSLFKLPIVYYVDAAVLLADLKKNGVAAISAAVTGGIPLVQATFGLGPQALLMGSEAHGLAAALQSAADLCVSIPMPAGVDSLSVNAAAAVIFYEIRRQRR